MANVKEGMKLIGGMEPTPEQIHRIQAIAHSFDIPQNDALFPFMVALETYHGIFTRLPNEITKKTTAAADKAAENAASLAKNKVEVAVAELVPSISGPLAEAAGRAVRQAQVGKSMLTVWGAMLIIGFVFTVGWFFGAHELTAAQSGKFAWSQFMIDAGTRIGLGIASPSLIMLGGLVFVSQEGKPDIWGWASFLLGCASLSVLILLAFK
ncbi:MAG: hypothetical protein M0T83_00975 [Nitrospiraceae bacterium]|jgi:hypothetical protein|uniref:Uncharacterized protein n=1 Tax=Leptospirillum ferriphilum (strain ML-04) TaxID=1048260 RepID=J9ZEN1_LEPFM|nr:hypothetical protein [Leptospirillum ferriphilum]AFS54636.1 hypothetical protein LFML04_2447 [Leptospirillum ferriphilum ML-04]MDA8111011.1 hypothetical protein [Nitrospiraceae bacterium]